MTTMIPTMHISLPQITDPREKILYVLRQFTSIPSGASVTYKNETTSMQYIAAKVGHNSQLAASQVEAALLDIYRRVLPEYTVTVGVTPVPLEAGKYNLEVVVSAYNATDVVSIESKIIITDDFQITFSYASGV